ncbi:transporter substrate-binding domain-containing protein [Streptomyces sp. NBC_00102]|uniref:transporter substrate-binding domain-containing protein n=1 Tax=Streptomyces sp. NBC_00102 TaxID=2975652 RepID=UPI00225615E5|nr:transporter substrate-binding domain-containing protein [Streptomyces sp. NBC_00102]MCX5401810.1 transporter substrate-binding domain-containing protein [Streptomyces sp. NBC_00102]
MSRRRSRLTTLATAGTVLALAAGLSACGDSDTEDSAAASGTAKGSVVIGAASNGAAKEITLDVPEVASIRSQLPKSVIEDGKFTIGLGMLPAGSAPLGYVGDDQKTITGSEPDLGRLVAAVFGLKAEPKNATWENLFVGIDSGRTEAGFSNITDTEERKKKYEFACYRQDNLGFEVSKEADWNFDGDYKNLAGKTIAVGSGTNQEKILLEWRDKLESEGKKLDVKYFADNNSAYLALNSKKIDGYFGPNPAIAYHITQSASTPQATRSGGTYSGAGASLQGLICATAKKDSGLAKPLAEAINYLIENGQYAKWLEAWNLKDEAVQKAEVNPPGLPITNS